MTEPVAYRYRISELEAWKYLSFKPSENFHWRYVEPLYTAEKLHPRVKMTQAEFDELNSISECVSVYVAMKQIYSDNDKLMLLKTRFGDSDGQAEFARLWFEYRIKNKTHEETIEIIPDMKWFVRNRKTDSHGNIDYLMVDDEMPRGWYPFSAKGEATAFDTEEQAELWTNPLTEAVQLPVEGE